LEDLGYAEGKTGTLKVTNLIRISSFQIDLYEEIKENRLEVMLHLGYHQLTYFQGF
jgi:hypothetical protein